MYYCIACKKLHEKTDSAWVFKTGFHTLSKDEIIQLGICQTQQTSSQQVEKQARSA
ncbi:DUF3973 domain-containing protein [Effusibacillus consociatus]|uniref:DUF3973 domain-containing protein n=1 Tax=Effusibacillus consociatus TaxID=1117041 RepID=A0ABV9PZT4_9BACL